MSAIHRARRLMHRKVPAPLPSDKLHAESVSPLVNIARGRDIVDMAPVSLTTAAKRIIAQGNGRFAVRLINDGPGRIVFGGPAVTLEGGTPIEAGTGYLESDAPDAEIWAVSDSTATLRIIPMK